MKQLLMSILIFGFVPFLSVFAQMPDAPILSLSADSLKLEDGAPVNAWKSAEGLEMLVPVATLRGKAIVPPIFSANGMAGCPAVFFKVEGGNPAGLTLRDFAKNKLTNSSFTIALLMQAVNTGFGICGTNPNGDGGVPRLYATNITFTYDKLENAIEFKDVFEKPVALIFEYDKDKQTAKVFRDGKLIGEKSNISPVNTFGGGWLTIPFQSAALPRSGYIAKLTVYNRVLSDTERQNLELEFNKYLSLKKK
jgi:hypothetical protein